VKIKINIKYRLYLTDASLQHQLSAAVSLWLYLHCFRVRFCRRPRCVYRDVVYGV